MNPPVKIKNHPIVFWGDFFISFLSRPLQMEAASQFPLIQPAEYPVLYRFSLVHSQTK